MSGWRDHPLYKRAAAFAQVSQDEIRRVSDAILPKAASVAKHVPFAEDAVSAFYAATDPDVPSVTRAMIWAPLLYFVVPLDGIPDIIPGLGFVDDAAVITLMLRTVASAITPAHRNRARETLGLPQAGSNAQKAD